HGESARRGDGAATLGFQVAGAGEPGLDRVLESLAVRVERGERSNGAASRKALHDVMKHREWEGGRIPDGPGRPREAAFDHQDPDSMPVKIAAARKQAAVHVLDIGCTHGWQLRFQT